VRNFLLGLLLGTVIATGAGVWAQNAPGLAVIPQGSGSMLNLEGGMSLYQDSTGRTGTIYSPPGSNMQFFNMTPGRQSPC
jgi:hypothetical protein